MLSALLSESASLQTPLATVLAAQIVNLQCCHWQQCCLVAVFSVCTSPALLPALSLLLLYGANEQCLALSHYACPLIECLFGLEMKQEVPWQLCHLHPVLASPLGFLNQVAGG